MTGDRPPLVRRRIWTGVAALAVAEMAEWHGSASFAVAAGRLATWTQLACALAPVAAGALQVATGYGGVLLALAGVGLGAVAATQVAACGNRHDGEKK